MTGWTWMRYSYAWGVTPSVLIRDSEDADSSPWHGAYISLCGDVWEAGVPCDSLPRRYWGLQVGEGQRKVRLSRAHAPPGGSFHDLPASARYADSVNVGMYAQQREGLQFDGPWLGRVDVSSHMIHVDTEDGRFTGESVAGLVVGAMGCFIFGLYLRAWLRERKALASQPEQDMIA